MTSSLPVSLSALAVVATGAVFVLGAAVAHAETPDDARLRQLAGQAASYAVRTLLAKGADPNVPDRDGRTAVHGAAAISAAETMQALLDAGGNPNRRDKDGNTPLHFASAAPLLVGTVATIRLLLRAEADPGIANGEGRTALHLAASHHEQPEAVEALLASGANPNRKDGGGDTALHAAVGPNFGWPAVVGALLDGGADPLITNGDGLTALQLFVWDGPDQGRTAALLVEAGADPNRKYGNGDAPLHVAIRRGGGRGKVEVAEALLAAGADPCIRDGQGFIAYSVAAEGGQIHQALGRAGGYDRACDGRGEAVTLDSDQRRRIQEALAGAGFDPGPADGKFGPRTRRAIEGWQRQNGHPVTGKLAEGQAAALLEVSVAPLEPFGPNWIVTENQPCQLHKPNPKPGETVTWSGDCVDGKASGEGRVVWRGSYGENVYEGGYRDGKSHGHGTYTSASGDRYEGGYRDGKLHGHGTFTWASGDRYEGELRDGKTHGRGTYAWASGDRYEGELRDGKRHGHGTYTTADGHRYEGEWRDGNPNGHGTYTTADGRRYEGEWRDGCFGERDGRWAFMGTTAEACGFE